MTKSRAGALLGLVLLLTAACAPAVETGGEAPAMIARESLFGNPEKAQVRVSPDGNHISFLAPVDGVLNVWVAPAGDPTAAQPVTQDTNRGVRNHSWAYSNEHIIYLQDIGGDENWRAYATNVNSKETIDLTPLDDVQAQIQEVSHKHPGQILLAINDRDPRLHDLYLVDLATAERTKIEENPGYVGWVTDDDYNVRVGVQPTPDGGMMLHRKTAAGAWEEMAAIPADDLLTTNPLGFDASGERLYMLDSRGRNTAALMAVNMTDGNSELIYQHEKADVDNIMIHPTTLAIEAASATYARREWTVLDEAIQKDLDYLAGVANGEIEILDRSHDDATWIVGYELADSPYRYYFYNRTSGEAKLLFTSRPGLETETLAPMHPVVIPARDGLELVSYLTLPTETDTNGDARPFEPQPMVLFVHGGPWARDNWGYNSWHQWMANRGYAVLSVNYRGSTGMGKDFTNAANMEWAEKMHDDLIDAVNWAVAEGIADPEKVAIAGGSYGGYATLVGLTFTPETFACGVDIVGPSNLVTLIESIPPYWEPMIELFATRVGDPRTESGRQLLTERSPLSHVDKIQKPLLIGQGANDPRVKQHESDQIVTAMQEKSIPVTYVLFPDEGHGFARPVNRLAFNAVAEAFLGECLGGRVEPIGDLDGSTMMVPTGADQIAGLDEALKKSTEETPETGAGAGK